jgi:hypothetical protein
VAVGITFFAMSIIIHLNHSIGTLKDIFTLNPNLETPYFIMGLISFLLAISGFWLSYTKIEKVQRIPLKVCKKCYNCYKELSPNIEQVEVTKNISNDNEEKVRLCRDCIIKELDKQDGVCPQCKKPLKWNGNLREFFGEWYHPKCVFELQQGKSIKEVKETREVVVKFRCPYCKYIYDDSLDKCPQCGGAHS